MRVFLHGSEGRPPGAEMVMFATPAADPGRSKGEVPELWVDNEGKPVSFVIEFKHGEAEVEPTLGKYLVERGMAHKTRLVLPGYWN